MHGVHGSSTMSLSDESFPEDDLHITTIDRNKSNVSSCISSSPGGNDQNFSASTSGQSSSGTSRETTQSDPMKNPEHREEEDYQQKVRSCQDLNYVHTKRRYSHVKSKVREFIESQKAEDQMRKSTREYIRRMSIPEMVDRSSNSELQTKTQDPKQMSDQKKDDPAEIKQVLVEREQEMMGLKALNEYLQSSLQEKMIEATRLRRNVDSMRIELMHAKDKAKRHSMHSIGMEVRNHYSPRLSLPTLVYKLPRNTTGTQTDFVESPPPPTTDSNNNTNSIGLYDPKNVAAIQPVSLNFSNDHISHIQRKIRRRNNSNTSTPTGEHHASTTISKLESDRSDSAIDTEEGDDSSSENVLREQFMIIEKDSNNNNTNSSRTDAKKKKRSFKRKWKWLFGPCAKCSDQKNHSVGEQYCQAPLLDSMYEYNLRVAGNQS